MPRRYSEFVFLWECLTRRYPFRLFPSLPPKRIGREFLHCIVYAYSNLILSFVFTADEHFLEQRR